ncbi:MAG: hypothetical protein COA79_03840 [Planctomycetota bacterium]|nr:MAG: hypothetical protein COA79_03840 [Planctomycetota bacterium]
MVINKEPTTLPIYNPIDIGDIQLNVIASFFGQLKIQITSCLNYEIFSNWKIIDRVLDDDFFFFIEEGKIKAQIENQTYIFKSNEFVIIPQGIQSTLTIEGDLKKLKVITLHGYIHNHWNYPILNKLTHHHFKLPETEDFFTKLSYLTSLMTINKNMASITGNALISQLFLHLIQSKQITEFPKIKLDSRVEKSLDYINQQFEKDLTVTDLAKVCRLSEVRLRKIFKLSLGISPKNYIAQFRINQACKLLKTTQLSIKEISFKTGFNDEHYFHLSFKKQTKKTPTEYRNFAGQEI